jgi:hypothetical protein
MNVQSGAQSERIVGELPPGEVVGIAVHSDG